MPNLPIVIAHRGASGYLPEHTLESKAMAHAMGADYIEQDLALSRDGQAVVIHDIHLESVTNVAEVFRERKRTDDRYYVIDFDWEELRLLRVYERMNTETGQAVYTNRFPGKQGRFQLHRLQDELELIQGLNRSTGRKIGIYPEIKKPAFHRQEGQDISKSVLKVLADHGYRTQEDPCYLQCFDPVELKRIRHALGCQLKLVQLIGENSWNEASTDYNHWVTPAGLDEIASYADGIGPSLSHLHSTQDGDGFYNWSPLVPQAHERKLLVHPFTFRKETVPDGSDLVKFTARILRNTRIDGFFTDFPDLGRQSVDFVNGIP